MSPLESISRAIDICGVGVGGFAALIGARQSAVSNWRSRLQSGEQSAIPVEWCPAIERATNGAVTCEQLNPAFDWAYLRGTAAAHDQIKSVEDLT